MEIKINKLFNTIAFEADKDVDRKLRAISLYGFFATLIILLLLFFKFLPNDPIRFLLDCFVLVSYLLVFLMPKQYFFLFVTTMLLTLSNIFAGSQVLGFVFYLFGCSIGFKMGLYKKHTSIKIFVSLVLFFLILFLYFTFYKNTENLVVTLVNIGVILLVGFCFWFMFHDDLKSFYTQKPILDLRVYKFTLRQKACLRGCMEQKTLKVIAEEQIISESAIKREMLVIYETLKVEDRHELYYLLSEHTITLD